MNESQENKPQRFSGRHGIKALRIVGLAVGGVALAALFALLFGILVKVLWNWLMPAVFGLPTITFWQAFGLVLLAKILFGAFGHSRHDHDRREDRHFHLRFKKFVQGGASDRDGVPAPGNGGKWKQFRRYWEEEGQAAFDSFLKRKEAEGDKEPPKT